MDGSGHYQPAQGPGGMHFYSPAQLPQFPQTPVQGGVPLYPAMNFPVMPVQLATNSLTPAQFPLQPAVGIHPAMMNNMMPGRGLPPPGPSTPTPAKQAIPTFHHGPMAVAQPEVPFDPNTPPPFADRAQMQTPRRNGVLKIANVSLLQPICRSLFICAWPISFFRHFMIGIVRFATQICWFQLCAQYRPGSTGSPARLQKLCRHRLHLPFLHNLRILS